MLSVFIDFKSAGCLLAIDPIVELAERHDIRIDWRPFSTMPRDLPDSGADTKVIESHWQTRLAAMRAVDVIYAKARGIELVYPPEQSACELALGALAQITGERLPFIRACFDAYWHDHADLNDKAVVQRLIGSSGAEHSGDLSLALEAFKTAQQEAEAAGVVEAPAMLVDGQLFIGRQHLPWVEEIVQG